MVKKKSSGGVARRARVKARADGARAGASARKPAVRSAPKAVPTAAAPRSPTVVDLGDALNIADVSARHAECKRLAAGAAEIEIDASRVQSIDTAGLQLLAALVREARARNLVLRWRAPSKALREGAARLGLGPVLRLP